MSAVGNSESAPSIVRTDPSALAPPNSEPPHSSTPDWAIAPSDAGQPEPLTLDDSYAYPAQAAALHPSERPSEQRVEAKAAPLANHALFEKSTPAATTERSSTGRARSGGPLRSLLKFAVAVALLGGVAWGAVKYAPFAATKTGPVQLTHKVERRDLVITVTEEGNIESANNNDIRCLVAGGGVIKDIIADGTIVKPGDKLIEIDSAAIDTQILTQKIAYEKARAVRDQAKNDLEAAKISLREYVEGTYVKERQAVDSQITIAEENLRSAQNTLLYTERMFRKGYVTPLQLESQQFAVKRSGLDLDTAKTAKRVLEEFTFAKMKNDLETLVATTGAKASSEEAAFSLEESKLKLLETQKQNCIILAPQAGMVVYANESSSFGRSSSDRPKIEEGASVRENQVMLRVPDLTQMQAKATIHESRVESLRLGMPASLSVQNRKLTGHVTFIANQPEPTSSFMASVVKKYAALVRIDGTQNDLKPGMTAVVEILVAERKGVLTVPEQCIVQQGGKFYCWKLLGDRSEKTEVKLGPSDDRDVEVASGLSEGDLVLQNPPEKSAGEFSKSSEAKQFGEAKRPGDVGAGPAGTGEGSRSGGGRGPGGAGGGGRMDIMASDADGDGKVSLDEAPEPMRQFFGRMDTDGDGFITAAEAAAARARRAASGGGPPSGAAPGAGPGGNQ